MKALYLVSMAIALGMALPANAVKNTSVVLGPNEANVLKDLAEDGMLEVRLGQLAEKNGANSAVKDFGKRMVHDHSQANDKLMAVAKQLQVDLPAALGTEQMTKEKTLAKLNGKDFDRTYISSMIRDHQRAVEVLQKEAAQGTGEFKTWAAQTLPTVKEHLQLAESLKSSTM